MSNVKVSIIVPVYNVEQYLGKCLDSLVNQTLQEIEILVVNDGSPDNSQRIIDDYVRRYPNKVRSFTKENGGLSDARNFAIPKVVGEYIAFVDSDDYVDLDMYERMYNRAIETEAEIVCSPITYVFADRCEKRFYNKSQKKMFGNSAINKPGILKFVDSYACNKIYCTELWKRCNYKFPKGQFFEDSATIYKVLLGANKIENVNIPFYNYVNSREGQITKAIDERIFDIFKSCDSILDAFSCYEERKDLLDVKTYLCVKHILARIRPLIKQGDSRLAKRFLKTAYEYLNDRVPEWRQCSLVNGQRKDNLKKKISKFIVSKEHLAVTYFYLPVNLRAQFHKIYGMPKKFKDICKSLIVSPKIRQKASLVTKQKKIVAIQAHGLSLINLIQSILESIDVKSFADFGTMLGIVREGRLLAHDMDVDIGVLLNNTLDIHKIRILMERNGFKLWRQYIYGEDVVEESYTLKGLKVDLNYYKVNESNSYTWLFYTKPGYIYDKSNERHIVEMSYSTIKEMKTVRVNNVEIVIPANAEQLLVEKYGESWRTPDTGWIYWQSPAARKLELLGRFVTYEYRII